jgi:hypothetical protein
VIIRPGKIRSHKITTVLATAALVGATRCAPLTTFTICPALGKLPKISASLKREPRSGTPAVLTQRSLFRWRLRGGLFRLLGAHGGKLGFHLLSLLLGQHRG